MSGNETEINDFHEFITKVVNPKLNNVIGLLYSYGGTERQIYRVNYALVKHSSSEAHLAREIEEWRNEIYQKYSNRDLESIKDDFIKDYYNLFKYLHERLQRLNSNLAKVIFETLYGLGENLEEQLNGDKTFFSVYNLVTEMNRKLGELHDRVISLEKSSKSLFKKGLVLGFIAGVLVMGILIYELFL
ncbi:hypothetical protein Asulf_01397 [Archaeoglobus sulfaticallidus PM70-1]|uniref:Uncharacterized protein n=1 Tax=Archaeoglobus sulfaticallidus PM70-1 TaxID=387631 RepID=N0BLG7_9EURY|nr:hypothetical protein [Archaeoglobus sulfaticallidus]AGK61386.1 hypothetical protein Asulf_01397 [Archaeoglobus sulfaticallidus PM70-1]